MTLTESEQREESEVGELLLVQLQTLQLAGGQLDVVESVEEGPHPPQADGVPLEAGLEVGGRHGEERGEANLVVALGQAQQEETRPGSPQHAHLISQT